MNSSLQPYGPSTKAITVPPCFIGPAGRVTRPPLAATASQA